jgi:hypothetical protein
VKKIIRCLSCSWSLLLHQTSIWLKSQSCGCKKSKKFLQDVDLQRQLSPQLCYNENRIGVTIKKRWFLVHLSEFHVLYFSYTKNIQC